MHESLLDSINPSIPPDSLSLLCSLMLNLHEHEHGRMRHFSENVGNATCATPVKRHSGTRPGTSPNSFPDFGQRCGGGTAPSVC